jgi:hypothetical protein
MKGGDSQEYRRMKVMVTTLMTVSGLLAACSTTAQKLLPTPGRPSTGVCIPEAAAKLVGHTAPDDAQIRQHTGAELIRRIAPGDAVTQDFRENRVTLAIDPAGTVVQASCG